MSDIPNGWVELAYSPFQILRTGDSVNSGTAVVYRCTEKSTLQGIDSNICVHGEWKDPMPNCRVICSLRDINLPSLNATKCVYNNNVVSCTAVAHVGTMVTLQCAQFYENIDEHETIQTAFCDEIGEWSPKLKPCKPICGKTQDGDKKNWMAIVTEVNNSDFYGTSFYGTILSSRIILADLLLFWDNLDNSLFPLSINRILIHDSLIDVIIEEPTNDFLYEIKDIQYSNVIRNNTVVEAGIALLVLKERIKFTEFISPICLYPNEDIQISEGFVSYYFQSGYNSNPSSPSVESFRQHSWKMKRTSCDSYKKDLVNSSSSVLASDIFCGACLLDSCQQLNGADWFYLYDNKYYLGGMLITRGPATIDSIFVFHDLNSKANQNFINSVFENVEGYSVVRKGNFFFHNK